MKDEPLHSWMEPEFEARIVSLVLGEASDFEREELERKIADSPEATLFFHRMQNLHGLLKQVDGPSAADEDEWKLSSERQENLLEKLGESRPVSTDSTTGTGYAEVPVVEAQPPRNVRRMGRTLFRYAGPVAASVALLFLLAGVLFTTLPGLQLRSFSPMAQQGGGGSYWYFDEQKFDVDTSGNTTLYAATEKSTGPTSPRRYDINSDRNREFGIAATGEPLGDVQVRSRTAEESGRGAGLAGGEAAEQTAPVDFTVAGVTTAPAKPMASEPPSSLSLTREGASVVNGSAVDGGGTTDARAPQPQSGSDLSFSRTSEGVWVDDLAMLETKSVRNTNANGRGLDRNSIDGFASGGMGGGGGVADAEVDADFATSHLSRLRESAGEEFRFNKEAESTTPPAPELAAKSIPGLADGRADLERNLRTESVSADADPFANSAPGDSTLPVPADPFAAPEEAPVAGENSLMARQEATRGRMLEEVREGWEAPSPAGAAELPRTPAPLSEPSPAESAPTDAKASSELFETEMQQQIKRMDSMDRVVEMNKVVDEPESRLALRLGREVTTEGLDNAKAEVDSITDGQVDAPAEEAKKMREVKEESASESLLKQKSALESLVSDEVPQGVNSSNSQQQNQSAREMPANNRAKVSEARDRFFGELETGAKKDQGQSSQLSAVQPSDAQSGQYQSFFRKEIDLAEFDQGLIPDAKPVAHAGFIVTPFPEKEAAEEPFSTFSLHVGEASFQLARAALSRSQWPERESIRVEEFVNALDYRDPIPTEQEKVAVALDQARHPFLQQRNLLRISLATAARGRQASVPLRLTLLLDNSGSMERPDRRKTVIRAFSLLLEQLQEGDEVTLISFARQPRLLADRVAGPNAKQLVDLVATLPSEGGTNIEAALDLAFQKAREQQVAGAQNRIILLTDGAANLGDAEPERLGAKIESFRNEGIAFDAAGIGAQGLNDEILEALTRKGDGRYYLLDRVEDADDGFARQIAGSLRPAAGNVKVQVEFNPDRVGKYHLLGFEKHRLKREDFRNDAVDAAEMAAAEAGVALYQVEARPDGKGDIGYISVRFRNLASGEMVEKRWPILYDPNAPAFEQAAPALRLAGTACFLGARLREDALGQVVDLPLLSTVINELPSRWKRDEKVLQLQEMIQQTRELASE